MGLLMFVVVYLALSWQDILGQVSYLWNTVHMT